MHFCHLLLSTAALYLGLARGETDELMEGEPPINRPLFNLPECSKECFRTYPCKQKLQFDYCIMFSCDPDQYYYLKEWYMYSVCHQVDNAFNQDGSTQKQEGGSVSLYSETWSTVTVPSTATPAQTPAQTPV